MLRARCRTATSDGKAKIRRAESPTCRDEPAVERDQLHAVLAHKLPVAVSADEFRALQVAIEQRLLRAHLRRARPEGWATGCGAERARDAMNAQRARPHCRPMFRQAHLSRRFIIRRHSHFAEQDGDNWIDKQPQRSTWTACSPLAHRLTSSPGPARSWRSGLRPATTSWPRTCRATSRPPTPVAR